MTDLDLTKLREIAEAATQWTEQVFITRGFSKMDLDARHIASFDPPTVLALIDEIESYSYRAGADGLSETPQEVRDDACDALRYAVMAVTR